jgi:NAD(P)-dependent dehydrogenase (short-subunit alcohol dehydrogenase family)
VLINRIAGLLKDGGRLVNLSSAGHRFSDVNLEDPGFEHTAYTEFGAYGRSKTANALFAVGFDARHKARGVRAAAVHPGVIHTELGRHMTPEIIAQMMAAAAESGGASMVFKSIPQGAATSVWAAIVAQADSVGAHYCEDCHVARITEDPAAARSIPRGPTLCGPKARRWSANVSEPAPGPRALA